MTREELMTLLEICTNYSFEYLQTMSLEELRKLYEVKGNA
jgi:hypothetical protein